jgi:predicted permease
MRPWKQVDDSDLSSEVREEISFYLEMRAKEFEVAGLDPADAWREAVRAFGDPDRIHRRVVREAKMKRWMTTAAETFSSVLQDLRGAGRAYRAEPTFTFVAVTTLALGIGASTAIFSIASQALLAGPPVADADGLAAIYTTCRAGSPRCSSSYPDFIDYRSRSEAFEDVAATAVVRASLGTDDHGARLLAVQSVTGNFFDVLGLTPFRGRLLTPRDDLLGGGTPVAVLSHDLWRSHFAADPEVVGSTIRLNGRPFEVVGIAPPGFDGLRIDSHMELWIPLQTRPYLASDPSLAGRFEIRDSRWMDLLVGRLAAETSIEMARAEMLALSDRLREEEPDARGPRSITVDPLDGYILPNAREAEFRTFVLLLGGTVGLTLLLCSANLANLLLARGAGRRRDISIRLAVGATPTRILRLLATESILLAVLGGTAGLFVAAALMQILGGFELPGGVPISSLGVALDARALGVATAITLSTAVMFGFAPAIDGGRTELSHALTSGRGSREERGSARVRKALVAVQIALSLVLLVGSGLFVRTLRAGLATDLGFDPRGVAAIRYSLGLAGYDEEDAWTFAQDLEGRVRAVSGVESVATATRVPLQVGGAMGLFFEVPGYEPAPDEELRIDLIVATREYHETLGIRLLEGRHFSASDGEDGERVAIVSRRMADRYWPPGEAVGGRVSVSGANFTVVGVVEDATWNGLADEVTNYFYVPMAQARSMATGSITVMARSPDADATLGTMRSLMTDMDRDVLTLSASTMDDLVAGVLMPQRMGAILLSVFGLLALVLSVVGVAGAVAYAISRRRREIAVRVALGATDNSILRQQVASMVTPVAAGLLAGTAAALSLTRLVEDLLYRVSATDPVTYLVIVLSVVAVSLVATFVPARAATRLDPAEVLGTE